MFIAALFIYLFLIFNLILFILLYSRFLLALFIVTKKQKQIKCPSTDKWINNMWYVHTMEYYLAIERN